MFRLEDLHLELLNFGSDAVLSRIARDQALFDCPLEGAMQHEMQTPNCSAAETGIAVTALAVDATVFHQILVELL